MREIINIIGTDSLGSDDWQITFPLDLAKAHSSFQDWIRDCHTVIITTQYTKKEFLERGPKVVKKIDGTFIKMVLSAHTNENYVDEVFVLLNQHPDWGFHDGDMVQLINKRTSQITETLEIKKYNGLSDFEGKILVPFSIESPLSGVGRDVNENEAHECNKHVC